MSTVNEEASVIFWSKVGFAVAVFGIAFIFGVLPLKVKGCGASN